jgi:hypothetical protein
MLTNARGVVRDYLLAPPRGWHPSAGGLVSDLVRHLSTCERHVLGYDLITMLSTCCAQAVDKLWISGAGCAHVIHRQHADS